MISENDLKKASTHVHEILLRLMPNSNTYKHEFSKEFEQRIDFITNSAKTTTNSPSFNDKTCSSI